jgi:TolB-like protein/tetratricopeptide (TPR) repeat protein
MRADLKRLKRETESRPVTAADSGSAPVVLDGNSQVIRGVALISSSAMPIGTSSSSQTTLSSQTSSAQWSSSQSSSSKVSAAAEQRTTASAQSGSFAKRVGMIAAVLAVTVLAAVAWFVKQRSSAAVPPAPSQETVAVLPLQNLGSDKDLDFLRLALADEIATSLSYARSLTIRPFATTSKYDSPTVDLQEAGRAMHVTDVVTGHYLKEGDQLQITLEAIDIGDNRTLWRDTMTVAAPDMIAMRNQITARVRQGLVPALGAGIDSGDGGTHPKNEEAYDLYLRSIALPHDPLPNKDAIAMLERAVGLDPTYATAWGYLGVRYHYDGAYANGGEAMRKRSDAALERAISLDPNYIFAVAWLITNRVEDSDLAEAYRDAKALVWRHPENAEAHFALAYVLRYGGARDESAHECDTALSLDSGNFMLRSCAFTFDQLGNYARALDFLQLDAGSVWSTDNLIRHYVRDGKLAQAKELAEKFGGLPGFQLMKTCLENPTSADLASLARQEADVQLADRDPEPRYVIAADLLFCGQKDIAVEQIKSAIAGHYCAYAGLQNDSIWAKLRGTAEFAELLSAAKRCRDDFLAKRLQTAQRTRGSRGVF